MMTVGAKHVLATSALLLLAACGGSQSRPLAAFAGTWQVLALGENGDTVASSTFDATEDTTGWTITFPGRSPVTAHVIAWGGDSVALATDPYESVLEDGVQVMTETVLRVEGDELSGTWAAHRGVEGPDSLIQGSLSGTREQ